MLTECLRACGRNIVLMRTRKRDDLIQFFMLQVLDTFSRMTSSLSARDEKFAWENYKRFITVGVNHVKYLRNQENVLSTFCQFRPPQKEKFSWNLMNTHCTAIVNPSLHEGVNMLSVLKYFLLYRLKTNKRKWTINITGCAFVPCVPQGLPAWRKLGENCIEYC